MAKNTKTDNNAKLDDQSKTADQLHREWLAALEESAVCHKELKEARQQLRKALDAWEERQVSGPLGDDGAARVSRRLLKSLKVAKQVAEAARTARDAEGKAWEACGLPAARRPGVEAFEDAEAA